MKDNKSRKLNLVRETLAPMDREKLAEVNGGADSIGLSYSGGQSYGISYSGFSIGISRGNSQSVGISIP